MNPTAHLNAIIDTWTHGTKGFVVLYGLIAVFSLGGLIRGKATLRAYVLWPVTTMVTLVVVVIVTQTLLWSAGQFGGFRFGADPMRELLVPLVLSMGGWFWTRQAQPLASIERRGARVFDGAAVQGASQKLRAKAS